MKLHAIIWNTCGYVLVKLYFIQWKFTPVIEKSSRVSLFLAHSVYMIVTQSIQ